MPISRLELAYLTFSSTLDFHPTNLFIANMDIQAKYSLNFYFSVGPSYMSWTVININSCLFFKLGRHFGVFA